MTDKVTILIVDDQLEMAKATGLQLDQPGYTILIVESAEEALVVLEKVSVDLVLTDVVMPGKDGYELCREICNHEDLKDVYVILISGKKFRREDIQEGLDAGARDFLVRPLQKDYLRAKISSFIHLKRTEDSLSQSESNFLNLSDQSPSMIFIELNGQMVYVNRAFIETLAFTEKECYEKGFSFSRVIAPEFKDLVTAKIEKLYQGNEVKPYEYALIGNDNQYHQAIMNTLLISYYGEPAVLGIITNITEKKSIEEALGESQDRLSDIAANIPGAVFQLLVKQDGTYEIPFMSESGMDLFERPLKEIMDPEHFFSAVHPDDLKTFQNSLLKAIRKMDPWTKEFRLVQPGGRFKWVRTSANPRPFAEGGILFNGVLLDITERKRTELDLEKYQMELEDLVVDQSMDLDAETEERKRIQGQLKTERPLDQYLDQLTDFVVRLESLKDEKSEPGKEDLMKNLQKILLELKSEISRLRRKTMRRGKRSH